MNLDDRNRAEAPPGETSMSLWEERMIYQAPQTPVSRAKLSANGGMCMDAQRDTHLQTGGPVLMGLPALSPGLFVLSFAPPSSPAVGSGSQVRRGSRVGLTGPSLEIWAQGRRSSEEFTAKSWKRGSA